jgi:hypothetical protein
MSPRWRWSWTLTLALLAGGTRADEVRWRPVGAPRAEEPAAPLAALGRPQAVTEAGPAPAVCLGGPTVVRCQAPGAPVPPVPPPPPPPPPPGAGLASPAEAFNCGVATGPAPAHPILEGGRGFCSGVRDCVGHMFSPCDGRSLLQSDHAFDTFASPVTNPFYFEDPRALTEVKPLFIYQRTPGSAPFFAGGNIEFFGVQARLALTQRLSFIVSELGGLHIDPHAPAGDFQSATGFAEVHLGPQYTIIRNECTGTLLAAGMQFEVPAGSGQVFQDTGELSLTPYVSFGQYFGKTALGAFHFLNTTGYAFGVDTERTDRFFSSFHLDYDIANLHHFYPLVELNWSVYPFNGGARNLNFEGRDLINFGSQHVAGENELSIAVGTRIKVIEAVQLGAAVEFPLLNNKQLDQWRLTFDLIFRY